MNDQNLNAYNQAHVRHWYTKLQGLVPVEQQVFEQHQQLLSTGRVLDIGIGGGRTTAYLLNVAKTYTGVDYAEGFVSAVKEKYTNADIRLADARDLKDFSNKSFELVNFALNGMDYVDAAGREKILSEIYRVLAPGGLFFFSTHNKAHPGFYKAPWANTAVSAFINLKTRLKLLPYYWRHLSQKKHEVIEKDFAIINDSAHNYQLLTFYTTLDYLRQQLQQQGFTGLCFYTRAGEIVNDNALEDWIFATCRKP